MKVLGVIPARGGSKGLPNKNLNLLAGKPLIAYAAEAANKSGAIDRLILSTDSQAIADLGRSLAIEVPFMRPADLATDEATMLSVLRHAVDEVEASGWKPDVIVLLQATSPLRRAERITEAVRLLKERVADSVVSVVEIPDLYSPQKAMRLEDGQLRFWDGTGHGITRRQQTESAYAREGTVYACLRDLLVEHNTIYGERCFPIIVQAEECLSIDTAEDWHRAEDILSARMN
jgi:CMP-N,N'-diacetyllegionaminic acid synthase